uniref:Uncharacterized protein n=1 Tax=Anguilla anguilla TaxID=7936 RepID=A0A0E9SXW7_ANGAN
MKKAVGEMFLNNKLISKAIPTAMLVLFHS